RHSSTTSSTVIAPCCACSVADPQFLRRRHVPRLRSTSAGDSPMLKKTLAALALGSALIGGQALAADYAIDKQGQHAFVNFKISHLGYSWLYGTFKDFDGSFSFDAANPE